MSQPEYDRPSCERHGIDICAKVEAVLMATMLNHPLERTETSRWRELVPSRSLVAGSSVAQFHC
jgi:hypothetical protein